MRDEGSAVQRLPVIRDMNVYSVRRRKLLHKQKTQFNELRDKLRHEAVQLFCNGRFKAADFTTGVQMFTCK